MAAKLREKDGFYWVVVHHQGRRKWKKIGRDKREALKVVHKVNAQLALGDFTMERPARSQTVEEALNQWYEDYKATFSPSFAEVARMNIDNHLVPVLGALRIAEVSESDLLRFISAKSSGKRALATSTIRNVLSVLRRVMALAVESDEIDRNPCRNLGHLLSKVERHRAEEVRHVDAWSREEVGTSST